MTLRIAWALVLLALLTAVAVLAAPAGASNVCAGRINTPWSYYPCVGRHDTAEMFPESPKRGVLCRKNLVTEERELVDRQRLAYSALVVEATARNHILCHKPPYPGYTK
jgi:hypothetical protein